MELRHKFDLELLSDQQYGTVVFIIIRKQIAR
jgi:hypothetical protein